MASKYIFKYIIIGDTGRLGVTRRGKELSAAQIHGVQVQHEI